jgi:hypothetical protein
VCFWWVLFGLRKRCGRDIAGGGGLVCTTAIADALGGLALLKPTCSLSLRIQWLGLAGQERRSSNLHVCV